LKLTIIADISSRISQERWNADRITAAAICLPSGALNHIRKRLPPDLAKWRNADERTVKLVSDVILREALGVGVYSIEKSGEAWDQFWTDTSLLNAELRGKISLVRAAYQIKCLLFVKSTTLACASAIKAGNIVQMPRGKHRFATEESFIFDKEIDGADNIEVFKNIWHRQNDSPQLAEQFGIRRNVKEVRLVKEQDEQLLMLPDYIAGIAHACTSRANVLAASKVSADCAQRTQRRFEQAPAYQFVCEPFSLKLTEILGSF
jgi:hypothetical protein